MLNMLRKLSTLGKEKNVNPSVEGFQPTKANDLLQKKSKGDAIKRFFRALFRTPTQHHDAPQAYTLFTYGERKEGEEGLVDVAISEPDKEATEGDATITRHEGEDLFDYQTGHPTTTSEKEGEKEQMIEKGEASKAAQETQEGKEEKRSFIQILKAFFSSFFQKKQSTPPSILTNLTKTKTSDTFNTLTQSNNSQSIQYPKIEIIQLKDTEYKKPFQKPGNQKQSMTDKTRRNLVVKSAHEKIYVISNKERHTFNKTYRPMETLFADFPVSLTDDQSITYIRDKGEHAQAYTKELEGHLNKETIDMIQQQWHQASLLRYILGNAGGRVAMVNIHLNDQYHLTPTTNNDLLIIDEKKQTINHYKASHLEINPSERTYPSMEDVKVHYGIESELSLRDDDWKNPLSHTFGQGSNLKEKLIVDSTESGIHELFREQLEQLKIIKTPGESQTLKI